MKSLFKITLFLILPIFAIFTFTGCGAVTTAIEKRNLSVQTKMSDSIFLEPVSPEKNVVYVRVRNTTDKDIDIESEIKNAFIANGFKVTKDPAKAYFMVQANLLQVGKSDASSARSAMESTFGGALLGAGIAGVSGSNYGGMAAAGLVGSLVGSVANAMVKDVYYVMMTDVEIRQRASKDEVISQNADASAKQGMSASVNQQIVNKNAQWKIYRTRVVSSANKVNLEFEEAKPVLIKGLTKSLSGLL